jgi:predicted transcriptional regulator
MSNLYCKRHQQSWPQGTEVTFGPRDEFGITRLPCCRLDRDPYDGPDGIGTKGEVSYSDLAASLTGSRIAEAKRALLETLSQSGPLAAEPASRAAGLDPDYGSPRLSTLLTDGLLEVADRKGVSDRGNTCGRYCVTTLGRAVLETFRRAA